MKSGGTIWIGLRRLGVSLLLAAALILPLNAVSAAMPRAHDCDCSQDHNMPCPVAMTCAAACASIAQAPAGFVFMPQVAASPDVIAVSAALFPRSLRPDLPPPRA